jgi:signal transduction histidine kinase
LDLDDALPRVPLDPDQMRRALTNLLDNAHKYTPPGGEIRVTAAQDPASIERLPTWVRISISDTGPGIAEQDLPHVFDRFYRGQQARSGSEKGAGLGLAIVRYIVETQHGGKAWIESAPGQGTTVHLALPLSPPPSLGRPYSAKAHPTHSRDKDKRPEGRFLFARI